MKADTSSAEQVGVVESVEDHGTIVLVILKSDEDRLISIYFDHRPFSWLMQGEGLASASDLIGRRIAYDGETVRFLD